MVARRVVARYSTRRAAVTAAGTAAPRKCTFARNAEPNARDIASESRLMGDLDPKYALPRRDSEADDIMHHSTIQSDHHALFR